MPKDTYEVGYKKPPNKTKFKKGKSGNPSGRPKGSKNKKAFFPLDKGNIYEFQKQIIDAGYDKIHVIKDGVPVSMSRIDAVLNQLYNKAMKGDIGATKLLLQYTQKSLLDLNNAADHVHRVTTRMREEERRKIFTPLPKPNTHGALLEHVHRLHSARFAHREIFGKDAIPLMSPNEPETELDWPQYNHKMRQEYLSLGQEPCELNLPEIPTILMADEKLTS